MAPTTPPAPGTTPESTPPPAAAVEAQTTADAEAALDTEIKQAAQNLTPEVPASDPVASAPEATPAPAESSEPASPAPEAAPAIPDASTGAPWPGTEHFESTSGVADHIKAIQSGEASSLDTPATVTPIEKPGYGVQQAETTPPDETTPPPAA